MDFHEPVIMGNRTPEELTPDEQMRLAHQKMHEQHKGHDKMHAEMFIVLVITLIVAQFLLIEWKKRHNRSYSVRQSPLKLGSSQCFFQLVTLLGLWLVPICFALKNHFWRFIFTWLLFTCISGLIAKKALEKPIHRTTPRLVYKWFLFLYKLSYVLGLIGYVVYLATFFGLNVVFDSKPHLWMESGTLFLFYGVYYGVLGRDVSEICADKMASHIGYYTDQGIPTRHLDPNVCAVCGNKLLVPENEEGIIENTYKLSCEHVFHEFCIRGWCIVGKKQTCPYCKEKVDLKKMFCNPWEKPHMLYGQLLDWIRWLVAWQPMIIFIVQGINWALGLE